MNRFFALLVFAFLSLGAVHAAELDWMTDYKAAEQKAAAEQKTLLLNFTGSDWCGWCIRLDKEVFSQPEFAAYAKEKLVLVKLDFPRNKPQSAAEKKQNQELAAKYRVRGYPTIMVLDSQGRRVGEMGYEKGGAEKWVQSLDKLITK